MIKRAMTILAVMCAALLLAWVGMMNMTRPGELEARGRRILRTVQEKALELMGVVEHPGSFEEIIQSFMGSPEDADAAEVQ